MGGLITVIAILLAVGLVLLGVGFFVWRGILRYAKSIERGLKMVPVLIHLPPPSDSSADASRDQREVIQEEISQAEVLYNLIAGTIKKGIRSRLYGQRHVAFEIIATGGTIKFFAAVPVNLVPVIEQAIQTAYPTATLEEVEDHNIFNPNGKITGTIGGEFELKENYALPIATFAQSKRDTIQALINGMTNIGSGDGAAVQILLRPAFSGWTKAAQGLADDKRDKKKGGFGISMREVVQAPFKVPDKKDDEAKEKPLSGTEQSIVEAIEEKTRHPGFEVMIRVIASSNTAARSQSILHSLVSAFALFNAPGLNGFKFSEAKNIESFVTAFIFRFFPPEANRTILNSVELSTLFHLPDEQFTFTSQVERQHSKSAEAPSRLPAEGLLLGYNKHRGTSREIRLTNEDRRRHVYIVGQTGTGKTTVLKQLIVQDMLEGKGLAFIDPHGDASQELLAMVPKSRTEDVIYFNPGDMTYPMGLNLFEFETDEQKDYLIQEAINMLYRLYDPEHQGIIGPIYEHWFRNTALTVMADPAGGTFIDIPKLLIDRGFLRDKLRHVKDPTVTDFWNKEMLQTAGSKQNEILGWFVAKFGAFASNEMMRNIIGQTKSAFDLRNVMDSGKILIANLSKGQMGELNSMLLGLIFVMKFQAAAMSRARIPENERRDFSLYVDEFQNYSTDSFATILAEARKYRLSLIVANQYISQLEEQIRDAVFGNVGTIVSFRAGPSDADFLVKQFAPTFEASDLINLPNFQTVARMMINGLPSQPFSMNSVPPLPADNFRLAKALGQLSAAKYGRPRSEVEAEIFKRLQTKPAPSPFEALAARSGPPSMPPPARPASGSSFLDEWLAKRKAGLNQPRPGAPPASSSPPQPVPPAASHRGKKLEPPPPRPAPKLDEPDLGRMGTQFGSTPPPKASATPAGPNPTKAELTEAIDPVAAQIKHLKAGEIYIDENGNIYSNPEAKPA